MQALKTLFRSLSQPRTHKASAAMQSKPIALTPAETKAVAGGLPRVGGFGTNNVVVARTD